MSAYKEFSGKTVEEALKLARDEFGAGLEDLDFEILSPGSRGVLGMGAEPARIVAAPRSALGGGAPKREAAAAVPLPAAPPRERDDRDRDRGPRRDDRRPSSGHSGQGDRDRGPRRDDRGPRPDSRERRSSSGHGDRDRGPRREPAGGLSASEAAEVAAARGSLASERADLEAAEASPEALAAGKEILETLMGHLGFEGVTVEIREGETSRLNVVGDGTTRGEPRR